MFRNFTLTFIFSLILCSAIQLNAQQLVISPSDTIYRADTMADKFDRVDFTAYIKNNQGADVTINWELVYVNVPSAWAYYYCDKFNCLDLLDFPSGSYALTDGDSAVGKAQFGNDNQNHAFWAAGYGEVHIKVYVAGDSANTSITGVYKSDVTVDSSGLVSSISPVSAATIQLFPNPALNDLYFDLPAEMVKGHVQIYSILGDLMMDQPIGAIKNKSLNVEGLNQGIYFARILDESNMVVKTIKFSKK